VRNVDRDARHLAALRADGWKVLTVWECDLRSAKLERRLRKFLDARSA
jgi:DNA mismatch endonuclease (patch repair protein)